MLPVQFQTLNHETVTKGKELAKEGKINYQLIRSRYDRRGTWLRDLLIVWLRKDVRIKSGKWWWTEHAPQGSRPPSMALIGRLLGLDESSVKYALKHRLQGELDESKAD